MIQGIDVSRHQLAIDWNSVKASGLVDFAYIKIGGGDDGVYTDSRAYGNIAGARATRIPFGCYWYFSGASSIDAQLIRIKSLMPWFTDAKLPFVVDLEAERPAAEIWAVLSLVTELQRLGLRVMIYTGAWWWDERYTALATKPDLSSIGLWMAAYQTATPAPCLGWTDWTVWQHSSSGRIPGIAVNVDLNWAKTNFWEEPSMSEKRIVTATALNIRPGPIAAGTPLGVLKEGQEVEAEATEGGWHRIDVGEKLAVEATAGGAPFTPTNGAPPRWLPQKAYISAAWTKPAATTPVDPPPTPTGARYRLGVHVIGDHGAATAYISKGAPAVTMMHGALEGFQRAQMQIALGRPNDRVVIRPWFSGVPSVMDIVNWVGPSPNNPPVVVVGSNEGDRGTSLAERGKFDYQLATELKMRQPNIEYAAMSSAHGNEDYTNPDVCRIVEQSYAPHYNSGLFNYIDGHNYTFQKAFLAHPPADAQMVAPEWFERRQLMLITKCGMRPDKRGFINTEAGVEAGHGGFAWAGYTQAQFSQWLAYYLDLMSAPFVFGGVTYASPFAFGTLFCGGKDSNWSGGYGIDDLWPTNTRTLTLHTSPALPPSVAKYLPRQIQMDRVRTLNIEPDAIVPSASDYALPENFMAALEATWR